MLSEKYVLRELRKIVDFYNEEHANVSSYGLLINPEDGPSIHFHAADSATYTSLAEKTIAELNPSTTTHEISLSDTGTEPKSLYMWHLFLSERAPSSFVWCVSDREKDWQPFAPLSFRQFGELCTVYLNSRYSTDDPFRLIGQAFEAGASRLALDISRSFSKADSAILWIYEPEAHYFQAQTIVGAAWGRYITGIGKGVVGLLSPTNRHVTSDLMKPEDTRPFHPDLMERERWTRLQYAAICSEGALVGAIGFYWRENNKADMLPAEKIQHIATLANIMLANEQANLTIQNKLDALERLIFRLSPAQALVSFLHDIQRSLRDVTTAMSTAAVVLDRSPSPERKSLAAQLSQSSVFVEGCINRMARLALLQEKTASYRKTDVQLVLRNMIPVLTSYGTVKVSMKLGSNPVWIRADRLSLERAVLNLVTNAVYWTEMKLQGGRRVTIVLDAHDGHAVIDVEDTGIGVGADVKDRLFEKFVTGRPDTGSGIGLFIVRETARAHGGEVTFFPNRHQGTTFRIMIPLVEAK